VRQHAGLLAVLSVAALVSAGQWRDPTGHTVREKSFVVELVHFVTPDVEARVLRVVDSYKRRFAQQSVLRIVAEAWASF